MDRCYRYMFAGCSFGHRNFAFFPWRLFLFFFFCRVRRASKNRVWAALGLSSVELVLRIDGPLMSFINKSCDSWVGIICLCSYCNIRQAALCPACGPSNFPLLFFMFYLNKTEHSGRGVWSWGVDGRLSGWLKIALKSIYHRYGYGDIILRRGGL